MSFGYPVLLLCCLKLVGSLCEWRGKKERTRGACGQRASEEGGGGCEGRNQDEMSASAVGLIMPQLVAPKSQTLGPHNRESET